MYHGASDIVPYLGKCPLTKAFPRMSFPLPTEVTDVPVLDGIIMVRPDDHTVSYEGNRYSEPQVKALAGCLSCLLDDIDTGKLSARTVDWKNWLLEVDSAGTVVVNGVPVCAGQLRRFHTGCREALAILNTNAPTIPRCNA